jgi:phage N-6-adenine-methyltransferase
MASSNQETATPLPFFLEVERFFRLKFKHDMAATADNAKCNSFFTKEQDSLSLDWPTAGWCWLNPPFAQIGKFAEKCLLESSRGSQIVSIWPLSGDLNMIDVWKNSDVYVVHGRVWPEVRGCMLCMWSSKIIRIPLVRGIRWDRRTLERIW